MKFIIIFLILLHVTTGGIGYKIYNDKITDTSVTNQGIEDSKTALENETVLKRELEEKHNAARINITFLTLALCPTLETKNPDAFCIKNSTEWLTQTLVAGMALTDPEAKAKMEILLTRLGGKQARFWRA